MTPYGLTHEIRLPETFTRDIPGTSYDRDLQLSVISGSPIVRQPQLINTWTTTWGTAQNDNKSDEESV